MGFPWRNTFWWSRYWIVITIAIILVVIGGVAFYIKVLLPIDREVTQELKREEELKKSIIRKRLLKERANQLEGLSDEEKEFQLKEWVEEEYKKEIPGYKSELRERFKKVPPLSAKEKERLIQIVGTRCCYPNCRENIALDVHHITPRAEGGTNKENNLIVLCPTHHRLARGGTIPRERLRQYSVANVKKIR
ncbi:MAG: HNH endonuclease signature motif containing protein [Candidatus Aenigmatarchaeota archaeon]